MKLADAIALPTTGARLFEPSGRHDQWLSDVSLAYASRGGVASGDEIARMLRPYLTQPLSTLARWIVGRAVVSFSWRERTLVPLFQFNRGDMSIRAGVREALTELAPAFDEWESAAWFIEPNRWLGGAAPADVLGRDLATLVDAARADRFVATG